MRTSDVFREKMENSNEEEGSERGKRKILKGESKTKEKDQIEYKQVVGGPTEHAIDEEAAAGPAKPRKRKKR